MPPLDIPKKTQYYVDTSIWLNLFKQEGNPSKGVPFWRIAQDFIERVMFSKDDKIVYSGIVLRELQIKLNPAVFEEKRKWFAEEPKFVKVDVVHDDKVEARKLESLYEFDISFYDLLHLALVKRLGLTLVTRDRQLLDVAQEHGVRAGRPEEL